MRSGSDDPFTLGAEKKVAYFDELLSEIRLQTRVVACALTKQNTDTRWVVDNEAQLTLGKIGEAILRTWPRKQEGADDSR